MLLKLLQGILDGLGALLRLVIGLLPTSPFDGLRAVSLENEWIGFLCYIVPMPEIIATLEAWVVSVSAFYLYSSVLRWIKAIE